MSTESTVFTLSPAGHRAVIHHGSGRVEAHKAHDQYTVVDPHDIRDKLDAAGFNVPKIWFNRKGNVAYVEARDPGADLHDSRGDAFRGIVRFKFDHRGKGAILGAVGALRHACDNQFFEPPLRIHHCSPSAQTFAARPEYYARQLLSNAWKTVQKLDALRGVWNGYTLLQNLPIGSTLQSKVRQATRYYHTQSVPQNLDMWGAMQALTHTRSPSLSRLASRLLGEHYNTIVLGDVPVLN